MSADGPRFETRRTADFERELVARAKAWIPSWSLEDDAGDFGRAVLHVAARFASEVGERLDRAGEKLRGGFFDWLGLRGAAARPARMPVVFRMVANTPAGVLAPKGASMQVDAGNATVNFETEQEVQVVPGRIAQVVAVDADADAIYFPPPGLWDIEAAPAAPTQWRLKSFAAAGSNKLQLDPPDGLAPGIVIELAGSQYLVVAVDKDIVTIDPPLPAGTGVVGATVASKVSAFAPFDAGATNRQQHALYLGHEDVLAIDAEATIDVIGAQDLRSGVTWQFWGKSKAKNGDDVVRWTALDVAPQQAQADAVTLRKAAGSVEARGVGDVPSARWIRAVVQSIPYSQAPLRVDSFALRVNCADPASTSSPPCPAPGAPAGPVLAKEGMANTTPLVLDGLFYPLGKTPKQFDAFYLACDEAFSKPGARVTLCFDLATTSFPGFSAVSGGAYAGTALAGVADDGALHLYTFDPATGAMARLAARDLVQPPVPGFFNAPATPPPVPLDPSPAWRLPTWVPTWLVFLPLDFMVAVSAGSSVWGWHEFAPNANLSGWVPLGQVPVGAASDPIRGLVRLEGNPPWLVALRGGSLARLDFNSNAWEAVQSNKTWVCIAPVMTNAGGALAGSTALGLVGVADDAKLYAITIAPGPGGVQVATATALPDTIPSTAISGTVQPFAYCAGPANPVSVFAASGDNTKLVATVSTAASGSVQALDAGAKVTGAWLDGTVVGGVASCVASVVNGPDSYLVTWAPAAAAGLNALLKVPVTGIAGTLNGAPTLISGHVVVPGNQADALVASLDLSKRIAATGTLGDGIVVSTSLPALSANDLIMQLVAAAPVVRKIANGPHPLGNDVFYGLDGNLGGGPAGGDIVAYTVAAPGASGNVTSITAAGVTPATAEFTLSLNDHGAQNDSWIALKPPSQALGLYHVSAVHDASDPWSVTLDQPAAGSVFPALAAGAAQYWLPGTTNAREAPSLAMVPNPSLDASVLATAPLVFSAGNPSTQTGKAFRKYFPTSMPSLVVLDRPWTAPPAGFGAPVSFIVDAAVSGSWSHQLGDDTSNPELSWEYWNGAWSKLPGLGDTTGNLKDKGAVTFTVPDDIAATDWAGKSHPWVRARLVGGDYGTDKITVITTGAGTSTTQQTVQHSTEGFKPPVVVSLAVLYSICSAVLPKYVIAEDSGTFRDESDANRTQGAIVEAFIPVCLALGRLAPPDGATTPAGVACPPACEGPCSDGAASTGEQTRDELNPPLPATPAAGRSIFVGVDGDISGVPVNLLCAIGVERDHDAFAPMRVSTLVGARLTPLVASDGTRALGESGIVTMAFEDAPGAAELFGSSLRWIRLEPRKAAGTWAPSIAGMYLNAAWASAQETLTRELLGSSEGAPGLVVTLARPPVLRGTLVLRVNEPLGDEEIEALNAAKDGTVIADPQLAGQWVLWQQVDDPAFEAAGARVYALDEVHGTITFGDGLHGRIPPLGRDNIVAFEYQRTDPLDALATEVPGNLVPARTKVNLVTPLAGVEAAFSADQAAGGAPPEAPEHVLRFGAAHLRNRGRAIAAADFADLALETFPDIVQARALEAGGGVRLAVVMRGADPLPSRAQKRELARFLLAAAAPTFDPAGLAIRGPRLRPLGIELALAVDSLDVAGGVAKAAQAALVALFDTATGGRTHRGWPLGANPTDDEIALALGGIAHLDSIEAIARYEILADGTRGPWPSSLAWNELAWLAHDALRFEFVPMEVAA